MTRLGPLAANVVAWAAGAATAVTVGLIALAQVGGGLTGDAVVPLTQADAAREAQAAAVTPTPSPSSEIFGAGPSSSALAGAELLVTSRGGSVLARCVGGGAYLVYWTPVPGYHAKDVVRGPAATARLKFEGAGREIKISVSCAGGAPKPTIGDEPHDDHSPGDD